MTAHPIYIYTISDLNCSIPLAGAPLEVKPTLLTLGLSFIC